MGKSTFLNIITGYNILPSGAGAHVTNTIFRVSYAKEYSVSVIYCDEKEFNDRCSRINKYINPDDMNNTSQSESTDEYEQTSDTEIDFCSSESMKKYLNNLQLSMTGEGSSKKILSIKYIHLTIPSKNLKKLNIELLDAPGINSGNNAALFHVLTLEAALMADRILFFPNSLRPEFPTDVFSIVGRIFENVTVQKYPKTFGFCYGGIALGEQPSSFTDAIDMEKDLSYTFANLISHYFNYKFDDIPDDSNLKKIGKEGRKIKFEESKKLVCELIKNEFCSIPIPRLKTEQYNHQLEYTLKCFELMICNNRRIKVNRVIQQVRDLAKLIAKSKYQTGKNDEEDVEEILNECYCLVTEFLKDLPRERREALDYVREELDEQDFIDVVDNIDIDVKKNSADLIKCHLAIIVDSIKAKAEELFKNYHHAGSMQEFQDFVSPIFDKDSDNHVIFVTEFKGILNAIFESYKKKHDERITYNLDSKF